MPRVLSPTAFREAFAQESGDAFIYCLTLSHSSWGTPLRVCLNNRPLTRYTPNAPAVTKFGIGGTETNGYSGTLANYILAGGTYVVSQTTRVTALQHKLPQGSSRQHRYAIYTDNAGYPGTLVAQTPVAGPPPAAGWYEIAFSSPVDLAPGTYWLAVMGSGGWYPGGWADPGRSGKLVTTPWASGAPGTFPAAASNQSANAAMRAVGPGTVQFQPAFFDLNLPEESVENVPEIQLTIDNVDRSITDLLREIDTTNDRVKVALEVVLGSNPDDVQFGPAEFHLMSVNYNVEVVQGSLSLEDDVLNTEFPGTRYLPSNSPGLYK